MQLVDFKKAEELLLNYKIPFPKAVLVFSSKDAVRFANGIGYPVFLKVYGKNILHRTELGGVLQVNSKGELEKTYLKMSRIKGCQGVIIQQKIQGKSLIIGMKRDNQFGPVILVGIGGIFTEILNDVSLRIAPVSKKDAMKMLSELKGFDYLCGKRDKKVVNLEAIAKIISAISELALSESEVREIDLNPVIVDQKEAFAVDYKFII